MFGLVILIIEHDRQVRGSMDGLVVIDDYYAVFLI
jgi:hypothetical protein